MTALKRRKMARKIEMFHREIEVKVLVEVFAVLAILLMLLLSLYLLGPSLTGFVTVSKQINHTDIVSLEFNESGEYVWNLANLGELKDIKIDGSKSKNGSAKVYIENNGVKYLIFDSSQLVKKSSGIFSITGFAVKDKDKEKDEIEKEIDGDLTQEQEDLLDLLVSDINETRNDVEIEIEAEEGEVKKETKKDITDVQDGYVDDLALLLEDSEEKVKIKIKSKFKEKEDDPEEESGEGESDSEQSDGESDDEEQEPDEQEEDESDEEEDENNAPAWNSSIDSFVINSTTTINLDDYYYDADGDALTYSSSDVDDVSISIEDNVMTVVPDDDIDDIRSATLAAYDGVNITYNIVSLIINTTEYVNATIDDIINETPEINETNQTVINDTEVNETAEKEIEVDLEYGDYANYDANNDGTEDLTGVIDFTTRNSEFNWDVNENNLCTRYEVYSVENEESTFLCYGSGECCAFVDLANSRAEWNDSLFLTYGGYGSTNDNKVFAQVLHVDYNVTQEIPYSDIIYSKWDNLTAKFEKDIIEFEDVCVDTCLVSGFNSTSYKLIIEINNTKLTIDNIDYSVEEKIFNDEPTLLKNIGNVSLIENKNYTLDLTEYFFDNDNDTLVYSYFDMENVSMRFEDNNAYVIPDTGFVGNRFTYITANDSYGSVISNVFKITVNESGTPRVQLGKPVRWKETIALNTTNGTAKLKLPKTASNITLVGSLNNSVKTITKDEIKIIDKGKNKTKDEFEKGKELEKVRRKAAILEEAKADDAAKVIIEGEEIKGEGIDDKLLELEGEEADIEDELAQPSGLITGAVVADVASTTDIPSNETIVEVNQSVEEITIEYVTEPPYAIEKELSNGKQIKIISETSYTDVLAYTDIKESKRDAIKLYWVKDTGKEEFTNIDYLDTNLDGSIDRLEWVVPHLSNQTFEVELTILNVQSFPTVGGNWTVRFNTSGTGNLTIFASNGTTYSEMFNDNSSTINDLVPLSLVCNNYEYYDKNNLINDFNFFIVLENNSKVALADTIGESLAVKGVYLEDYSCNATGFWTVKVLTEGKHHQQFNFSGQVAYANNFASVENVTVNGSVHQFIDESDTDFDKGIFNGTNVTGTGNDANVTLQNSTLVINAVNFDGTNDYLTIGTAMTGQADVDGLTISFWAKVNADGSELNVFQGSNGAGGNQLTVVRKADNTYLMNLRNTGNTEVGSVQGSETWTVSDGWHHVLWSVNTATPEAYLYINDIDDEASSTESSAGTPDQTFTDWHVGSNVAAGAKWNGDIAEFYYTQEFIDITVESNRRKFIDTQRRPVDLGYNCTGPSGKTPILCLRGTSDKFIANNGSGGGFTENGALTNTTALFNGTVYETEGNFTSQVFDSNRTVNWSYISWEQEVPYQTEIGRALEDKNDAVDPYINTSGLVLLMHFNNETGENDSLVKDYSVDVNPSRSVNDNATCNLAFNDCPTYNSTNRKFGNSSMFFDGENDTVHADTNTFSWNLTDPVTFTAWVKPVNYGAADGEGFTDRTIIGSNGRNVALGIMSDGTIKGYFFTSSSQETTSTQNVSLNLWHHLVYRYAYTSQELYLDGVRVGNSSHTGDDRVITNLYYAIGSNYKSGVPAYVAFFNGSIDEVAIWNRSLNASEILSLYKRGALELNISTRTSDDNVTWTAWSDLYGNNTLSPIINNSRARYLQYKAVFSTENTNFTPILNNVSINYTILENLSIWDTSDDKTVVVTELNTFYANYTDTVNTINGTNVWCTLSHNTSGGWSAAVNMSFNSSVGLYKYNTTFATPTTNPSSFNVTCDGTALGFNVVKVLDDFAIYPSLNVSIALNDTVVLSNSRDSVYVAGHINLSNGTNVSNNLINVFRNGSLLTKGNFTDDSDTDFLKGTFNGTNVSGTGNIANVTSIKQSFYDILVDLGLTDNLAVALDSGANNSYNGTLQVWYDLSNNRSNFTLGATGSASTDDPTFNGNPGELTNAEYFSFDGGDVFQYNVSSNPDWVDNLHKDNANHTLLIWIYVIAGASAQDLFGTYNNVAGDGPGVRFHINTGEIIQLVVSDGSSTIFSAEGDVGQELNTNAWNLIGWVHDEATGPGGGFFYQNGEYTQVSSADTFDATYTGPSAAAAGQILRIGGATNTLNSGTRIAGAFAFSESLTKAQVDSIYARTKGRFIGNTSYKATSNFTSQAFDANNTVNWTYINWENVTPVNTNLTLYTRTSADNITFSDWFQHGTSPSVIAENSSNQYIQYLASFNTSNTSLTPKLLNVTLNYTGLFTDSFGNYNFTFNAPAGAGIYPIKVNTTWDGTIPGESTINLAVVTLPSEIIINISPKTEGFGRNITLIANVTDPTAQVDTVLAEVKPTGESATNFTMVQQLDNWWKYNFTDYTNGTYTFRAYADSSGLFENSTNKTFDMFINLTILVRTLRDSYGAEQFVNLTDPPGLPIEEKNIENNDYGLSDNIVKNGFVEKIKSFNGYYSLLFILLVSILLNISIIGTSIANKGSINIPFLILINVLLLVPVVYAFSGNSNIYSIQIANTPYVSVHDANSSGYNISFQLNDEAYGRDNSSKINASLGQIYIAPGAPTQPLTTQFDGDTTDFTQENNLESVCDSVFENSSAGKIEYKNCVNAEGLDINNHVFIRRNYVEVKTRSLHSTFNSSANVTLRNLAYLGYPKILKDNLECTDCEVISWDSNTGVVVFNTTSFSILNVTEANQSKVVNNGTTNTSVYLLVKVQYYNKSTNGWVDTTTVVNDTAPRTFYSNGTLVKLDSLFNGVWNSSANASFGAGTYRVFAAATDENDVTLSNFDGRNVSVFYNFTVDYGNPGINFTDPTPANNSRATGNVHVINVSINKESVVTIDTCRLEVHNGTDPIRNYTMEIGANNCNVTISTIDGFNYTLKAFVNDTSGKENSTANLTFRENTKPEIPTLIKPTNNSKQTTENVVLNYTTFDNDTDVVNYIVYFDTNTNPVTLVYRGTGKTFVVSTAATGTYYWKVQADDTYENSSNSSIFQFNKNTAPPIPLVITPNLTGIKIGGNQVYNITWDNSTSDSDGDNISISIFYSTDSGLTYPNEIVSGLIHNGYYLWTVPSIDTDKAKIKVIANDSIEFSNDESDNDFIIDSTPPVITLDEPPNGSSFNNGTFINLTITDVLAGVSNVSWNNGTLNALNRTDFNGTYDINTSGWPIGEFNITVYANDTVGNFISAYYRFTIDDLKAVVEYNTPSASQEIGGTFKVNVSETEFIDDAPFVNFTYDNAAQNFTMTQAGTDYFYNFDTTAVSDGLLKLSVYGNDTQGRVIVRDRNAIIDNTVPAISLDVPANNSFKNGTPTFLFTPTDANTIASCSLITNSTVNHTTSSVLNGLTNNFTNVAFGSGVHSWTINCTDGAGNIGTNNTLRIVNVDLIRPTITLVDPPNESSIRINRTINFTVTDEGGAGVGNVTWTSNYVADVKDLIDAYAINTSEFPEGKTNITIRANDSAGNIQKLLLTYTLDITPPIAVFNKPGARQLIRGNFTVNVTATDTLSNVSGLLFAFNGSDNFSMTRASSDITSDYTYDWNTTNTSDKTYVLKIFGNDSANNLQFESRFGIIDNTAPGVKADGPANDTKSTANSNTFTFTPLEINSISSCTLYINGTVNATSTSVITNASNTISTTLSDGTYRWTLGCNDTAIDNKGIHNIGYNNTNYTISVDTVLPTFNASVNNTSPVINNVVNVSANGSDANGLSFGQIIVNDTGINKIYNFSLNDAEEAGFSQNITISCGHCVVNLSSRVNDTFNNFRSNDTIVSVGNTVPDTPTIIFPTADLYTNIQPLDINVTVSDSDGDTLNRSYYINNVLNQSSFGNITFNASDSYYILNVSTSDGFDVSANATVNFTIDTTNPAVRLDSPANNSFNTSTTFTATFTPVDTNLGNCTLYHNFTGIWQANETLNATSGQQNGFTGFDVTDKTFVWDVSCTDLANNNAFNASNFTITIDTIAPTAFNLTSPANGTSSTDLSPDFTWNKTVDVNFNNYTLEVSNGTGFETINYSAASTVVNETNATLTLLTDKTWYWHVIAYDKAGQNFTSGFFVYTTETASAPSGGSGDTGGGGGGGGGSSGGGGGGGGSIFSREAGYSISPSSIKAKTALGKSTEERLRITNSGDLGITVSLAVEGIRDLLFLSDTLYSLDPGESADVKANFIGKETGSFVGKIVAIGDGVEKDIPVILEVASEQVLFDAKLDIPSAYTVVEPGGTLRGQVTLLNVGAPEKVDVFVTYLIKDLSGNVVYEETETFAVEGQSSFAKSLKIPDSLEQGKYVAIMEVRYADTFAVSSQLFEVEEEATVVEQIVTNNLLITLVLLSVLAIFVIIMSFNLVPRKGIKGKPRERKKVKRKR